MALLTYLLFGGSLVNFFNPPTPDSGDIREPQTYVVTEELAVGEGALAEPGDVLSVHYVGTLSDGRVFDSSLDRNTPLDFTLGVGQVIRGWDEGLVGMRVGGKRLLVISPEYAYGEQGAGAIPPNSTLIFEVELLDAQKPQS